MIPHDLVGFLLLFFAAIVVGIGFVLGTKVINR